MLDCILERYVRNGILISNGSLHTHTHHTHIQKRIHSVHHHSLYSDRVLFGFLDKCQPEKRNEQCLLTCGALFRVRFMQLNKAHPETCSGFQGSHRASAGNRGLVLRRTCLSWIWAEKRGKRLLPEVRPTQRKGIGGRPPIDLY